MRHEKRSPKPDEMNTRLRREKRFAIVARIFFFNAKISWSNAGAHVAY